MSIFFILLVGIQVNAQTSLKKAFNDSQKDYNGIYTVLNIEETEENILKFAKKNDIVVLAVVNAQETTQYGEVYIPVTSFKYIKPLEFAEIQKRNNIQKQINSESELASIALFAALAYGTYKAVGYGAEYVIKGMVKAGCDFKGNQSNKSTTYSRNTNDIDEKFKKSEDDGQDKKYRPNRLLKKEIENPLPSYTGRWYNDNNYHTAKFEDGTITTIIKTKDGRYEIEEDLAINETRYDTFENAIRASYYWERFHFMSIQGRIKNTFE